MDDILRGEAPILVIDDDRILADMMVEFLHKLGYMAVPAYGGKEGLDLFRQGKFRMVITDVQMPEVDGFAVLERVKRKDKDAVVIVITGAGSIESAVQAIRKGAYDYIAKPFGMSAIEAVINRALERYFLFKKLRNFRRLFFFLVTGLPLFLIAGLYIGFIMFGG
jgi:DNA-binding NtrC family response regulator